MLLLRAGDFLAARLLARPLSTRAPKPHLNVPGGVHAIFTPLRVLRIQAPGTEPGSSMAASNRHIADLPPNPSLQRTTTGHSPGCRR